MSSLYTNITCKKPDYEVAIKQRLLAKLYAIIPKEKHYVKELLTELLVSSTATMDIIFEVEQMYAQLSLIKLTKNKFNILKTLIS